MHLNAQVVFCFAYIGLLGLLWLGLGEPPRIDSPSIRYLIHLLQHKYYVLKVGLRIGSVPLWRLLIHDWSKFLPFEFRANRDVVCCFGGRAAATSDAVDRQAEARLFHVHRCSHHWDYYWCQFVYADGGLDLKLKAYPMPKHLIHEMVADWLSRGRIRTGRYCSMEWYRQNKYNILLHADTRKTVEFLLDTYAKPLEGTE